MSLSTYSRHSLLSFLILIFCVVSFKGRAQTVGGRAAYNFLSLPSSPLPAAAGGINVSYTAADIGLTTGNPALLRPNISRQLNASFNAFLAGSKGYSLTGALFSEKWQTTFGGHVHFLDYGNLQNTDAAGNVMGQFRPADFVVQASASKRYLQNWTYGLTLKFIHSAYGQFRSSALAADVGVLYQDSASRLSAAIVVKNMGAQLKTYAGEEEELPFDLQVGITKRLAKAPFGFSLTAQHLQTFDILYSDTTFNQNNNVSSSSTTFSKILTHLVLASHIYLGQTIEATVGYNFLRRQQLSSGTDGSGLTGFSAGLRVKFPKLQVLYARSAYQKGLASNQIGLTMQLDRLLGLGQ